MYLPTDHTKIASETNRINKAAKQCKSQSSIIQLETEQNSREVIICPVYNPLVLIKKTLFHTTKTYT